MCKALHLISYFVALRWHAMQKNIVFMLLIGPMKISRFSLHIRVIFYNFKARYHELAKKAMCRSVCPSDASIGIIREKWLNIIADMSMRVDTKTIWNCRLCNRENPFNSANIIHRSQRRFPATMILFTWVLRIITSFATK